MRFMIYTLLSLLVLLLAVHALADPLYNLYEIPNPVAGPSVMMGAFGINSSGAVTGTVMDWGGGTMSAFLFSGVTTTILADPGNPGVYTGGAGINSSGQITGTTTVNNYYQAYRYSSVTGTWDYLGNPAGCVDSYGQGINDAGVVVGYGDLPDFGPDVPFISTGAGLAPLPLLPGTVSGRAMGINNSNQITGSDYESMDSGGTHYNPHGFVYNYPSVGVPTDTGTLPSPGYYAVVAHAINASGEVTGFSRGGPDDGDAFLYDGTMHNVGNLHGPGYSAEGYGINNSGAVVGTSYTDAFLYDGATMWDLNSDSRIVGGLGGWQLNTATGINDSGQICGYGVDPNGYSASFILTPAEQGPAPEGATPELPSSAMLLVSSLPLGLAWLRRRKR